MKHRWSDSGGVGDAHRVGRPAAARALGERRTGDVARADRHREAQREGARVVPQGLLVLDFDDHVLLRADVGDARGEDIGPFLLEQRRAPPGVARRLVVLLGGAALADLALDHALADSHPQPVHRGAFRKRKDVDPFEPLVGGVAEGLSHVRAGDEARHPDLDFGVEQGSRAAFGLSLAPEEQRALLRVRGFHRHELFARIGSRLHGRGEAEAQRDEENREEIDDERAQLRGACFHVPSSLQAEDPGGPCPH